MYKMREQKIDRFSKYDSEHLKERFLEHNNFFEYFTSILEHKSVKDNLRNYFIIQLYHVLSSYIYFNVNKKDNILVKRFFIYLFRSISYLFILNIKKSIKNIARLTAIIKYKLK